MCLTRVIGRKILQEDTPCFGIVELTDEGDKSVYQKELIVADKDGILKAKTEDIISADFHSLSVKDRKYRAGFHRFMNIEDARKRINGGQVIRKFTIPKGTLITIGTETEGYVVVTPILKLSVNINTDNKEHANGANKSICCGKNTETVA